MSQYTPLVTMLPTDLKVSNRMQILNFFKNGQEFTANEIAEKTGISRQTVMKAIQFFVQKGVLNSTGKANSTHVGGKRPELFSLSDTKYFVSILLWPDRFCITLLNFRFITIDSYQDEPDVDSSPEILLRQLGERCQLLLAQNHISIDQVYGVNVSSPGIVDYESNILKFNSLFPNWGRNVHIAEQLQPFFSEGTPILLENVAKVLGNSLLDNEAFRQKRIATVFSSWGGICSCLIENNKIQNGKDSLIGEIGHIMLSTDPTLQCGCGSYGCFEQTVSLQRLKKIIRKDSPKHPESPLCNLPEDQLTLQHVFSAAACDDSYAKELVSMLAYYFALALRNVSLIFNPEVIIFQGEYAFAGAFFQEEFFRYLRSFHYYPENGPFELIMDQRSIQELSIQGACTLLLNRYMNDSLLYE